MAERASSKTALEQKMPDLLDANTGLDSDVTNNLPAESVPIVKTREPNKNSLFDTLGITKIVRRNQEHARVLNNLKRYQDIAANRYPNK
ncbi:MAG: hypothetical protein EOO39_11075 [Cytophagaceae bacterium]|nr:MAG: hypothetical protein EOO39_11075 [Cytophagaceae bacterium]